MAHRQRNLAGLPSARTLLLPLLSASLFPIVSRFLFSLLSFSLFRDSPDRCSFLCSFHPERSARRLPYRRSRRATQRFHHHSRRPAADFRETHADVVHSHRPPDVHIAAGAFLSRAVADALSNQQLQPLEAPRRACLTRWDGAKVTNCPPHPEPAAAPPVSRSCITPSLSGTDAHAVASARCRGHTCIAPRPVGRSQRPLRPLLPLHLPVPNKGPIPSLLG